MVAEIVINEIEKIETEELKRFYKVVESVEERGGWAKNEDGHDQLVAPALVINEEGATFVVALLGGYPYYTLNEVAVIGGKPMMTGMAVSRMADGHGSVDQQVERFNRSANVAELGGKKTIVAYVRTYATTV